MNGEDATQDPGRDPAERWDRPDFTAMLEHLPKPHTGGEWIVTRYSEYQHRSKDDRECMVVEWSCDGAVEFIYLVVDR